jgi:hypothetical protein
MDEPGDGVREHVQLPDDRAESEHEVLLPCIGRQQRRVDAGHGPLVHDGNSDPARGDADVQSTGRDLRGIGEGVDLLRHEWGDHSLHNEWK